MCVLNSYDMWKIQIQALLIKNDVWGYVNDDLVKAEVTRVTTLITGDNKSKLDIILLICLSKLKQAKGCETFREVWLKLEGPARKVTLLKNLLKSKVSI